MPQRFVPNGTSYHPSETIFPYAHIEVPMPGATLEMWEEFKASYEDLPKEYMGRAYNLRRARDMIRRIKNGTRSPLE